MEHKIPRLKYRPNSKVQENTIKETIDLLLKYDIIEPYNGPYACRPFCVRNPDGSTRMVINYKPINDISEDDAYPKPSVPDKLAEFHGKTIYTQLDIVKAFMNVEIEEESRQYTAFVTKYGSFNFKRMGFGHKNNPAIWARAADVVFKDCADLIKYVDDFIVASMKGDGYTDIERHL